MQDAPTSCRRWQSVLVCEQVVLIYEVVVQHDGCRLATEVQRGRLPQRDGALGPSLPGRLLCLCLQLAHLTNKQINNYAGRR